MKKHLLKTMLLLCALIVGSSSAWATDDTASFAPSDFSGQGTSGSGSAISATVKGVTFACDKGYGTTQIRCYSGGKITISSSNTISEIAFTFSSGSYTGGLNTSYTGLSTTSWEQSLTSQARITAVSVTYTSSGGGTVDAPTFSPAAVVYTSAQNVAIETTTSEADIYYTLDGTDPTTSSTKAQYTSAINVTKTTTIKAIAVKSGMTDSDVATATYTIVAAPVVTPKNVNSNYYTKVTSTDDLENGDAVLIVSGSKALSTTQNDNNRAAADVTVAENVINDPGSDVQKLVLVKSDDFYFFHTSAGYLCAASSGSNWLRTKDTADGNTAATISISSGAATILFQGTFTRNYLRYNPNNGNPIFSCYATGSTTGEAVELYKEVTAPSQVPAAPTFNASSVIAAKKTDGTFESVTAPTLTTATGYDGTVTYASSETSVATVDDATGALTLVGVGSTTITATAPETTGFTEGTASYELTVYQIEDGVFDFAKGNYLSGAEALSTQSSVSTTWTAGNVTMAVAGRNAWYNGGDLRLYKAQDPDAAGSLTISASGNKIIKIVATGGTKLSANTGNKPDDSTIWTGYADEVVLSHTGDGTITLSKLVVTYTNESSTTVSVSSYQYATASFTSQVVVPSANTVYAVSGVSGNTLTLDPLAAGTVLGPNKGVIVYKATEGDVTFAYSNDAPAEVTTILKTSGTVGTGDYILGVNEDDEFGFCHPTENIECTPGKAFLPASAISGGGSGGGAPFLRIGGTTNVGKVMVDTEVGVYYDLMGRKVERPQRGIYIMNGKKVLVK